MKILPKRTIILGIVISLLAIPAVANAHDGEHDETTEAGHSSTTTPTPTPKASPSTRPSSKSVEQYKVKLQQQLEKAANERRASIGENTAAAKVKLDDSKRKICETHEEKINTIIDNMSKRRQNAFNRITQVATAVEAFYVKKQLSIANYDELVGKVDAAKVAAANAMTAQQAAPTIDCSGEHPKSDVTDFKLKRASSTDAMSIYRQTVKDLVKAVKTAAEAAKESAQ